VPVNDNAVSVTITKQAGRYYASFLFEVKEQPEYKVKSAGIGIDLGIKSFAVISDGRNYININKTDRIRKLTRKLKREQRKFSRKIKKFIKRKEGTAAKKINRSNLDKQRLKVQRAYKKLADKRRDYINKTVHDIITARPEYITIEDLNISGMMKNRHLSREIAACEFWYFRELLERKCRAYGIELRIADRFYASSKACSHCGNIKKDLKLSERVYICDECGTVIDRDLNAAVNLRDCRKYKAA
ncbi:MAG: transposase, partial [Synergistaceae bacterium]|nr:transposase [Synergistaceae bacterium]